MPPTGCDHLAAANSPTGADVVDTLSASTHHAAVLEDAWPGPERPESRFGEQDVRS